MVSYRPSTNKRNTHKRMPKASAGPDKIIVGKIYAEWCGHCQDLKPKWEMMSSQVKRRSGGDKFKFMAIEQKNEDAQINHVNSTYLQNSAEKLAIQGGYPTIFKIQGGKIEYYEGERDAEPMEKWAMGESDKADKPIQSKLVQGGRKKTRKYTKKNKSWFSFF
jgi:hypothetical protein